MTVYRTNDTDLKKVADAIRAKGGTSANLTYPNGFVTAIQNIPTGITPTGNINITGTAQVDVTNYATAQVSDSDLVASNIKKDVNILGVTGTYEGGGGGGLGTLLSTTSLGTLSTTNTSAADTGKSLSVSSVGDYDLLVIDVCVNSITNSRHISTVSMIYLTGTSNVTTKNTVAVGSNKWNIKAGSTGTKSTRQSTSGYGIYANSGTLSNGNITIPLYYRYNSNNTGTINGSYTARVYGIKLVDLIGG